MALKNIGPGDRAVLTAIGVFVAILCSIIVILAALSPPPTTKESVEAVPLEFNLLPSDLTAEEAKRQAELNRAYEESILVMTSSFEEVEATASFYAPMVAEEFNISHEEAMGYLMNEYFNLE